MTPPTKRTFKDGGNNVIRSLPHRLRGVDYRALLRCSPAACTSKMDRGDDCLPDGHSDHSRRQRDSPARPPNVSCQRLIKSLWRSLGAQASRVLFLYLAPVANAEKDHAERVRPQAAPVFLRGPVAWF